MAEALRLSLCGGRGDHLDAQALIGSCYPEYHTPAADVNPKEPKWKVISAD
jgi:hypothetical protein